MRTVRARDVEQLDIPAAVASVLPGLAAAARHSNNRRLSSDRRSTTFCPDCGGDKSRKAMRCLKCMKRLASGPHGGRHHVIVSRGYREPHPDQDMTVGMRSAMSINSTRHVHTAGTQRQQPPLPRMAKGSDGIWRAIE